MTPFVTMLSVRFGKKEIFLFALLYGAARSLFLWLLLSPEHPVLFLVNSVLSGFDNAAIFILCHAMISDVCDFDEFASGQRREGLFGAVYGWIYKTGNSLALVFAGYLLVVFGFQSNGADIVTPQSASTLWWIRLTYCGLPAFTYLVSAWFMWKYPISRLCAERIRIELKLRDRGSLSVRQRL